MRVLTQELDLQTLGLQTEMSQSVAVCLCVPAGKVKRLKAYKPWAAQVAATPPPSSDPLAPPKKAARQGKAGGDGDDMALVAAIRGKVRLLVGLRHPGGGEGGTVWQRPQTRRAFDLW
jgi:hypothetical protein